MGRLEEKVFGTQTQRGATCPTRMAVVQVPPTASQLRTPAVTRYGDFGRVRLHLKPSLAGSVLAWGAGRETRVSKGWPGPSDVVSLALHACKLCRLPKSPRLRLHNLAFLVQDVNNITKTLEVGSTNCQSFRLRVGPRRPLLLLDSEL